jgi:hypothetical protein
VHIVEEEASRAGRQPFKVYDFSGYNAYSTERFPSSSQKGLLMKWYLDSSHYRPALGKLVLNEVLNGEGQSGFGTILNSETIEQHLAQVRAGQADYRRDNPEDAHEVRSMCEAENAKRAESHLSAPNATVPAGNQLP